MQEILVRLNERLASIRRSDGVCINSACGDSADFLSASELVAAALGSCIAASVAPIFLRHELDENLLAIHLKPTGKHLSDGLRIQLDIPDCNDDVLARLKRAAERCPVRQALNVPVTFDWQVR